MKAHYWIPEIERDDLKGPSQSTLLDCVDLFQQEGYLVLSNALPRAWVEALSAAYTALYGDLDVAALNDFGYSVGHHRMLHPLPLQGIFSQPLFYAHPLFYTILMALLGPKLILNNCAVVVSLPGAEAQRPHRDSGFLFGWSPASVEAPVYGITLAIPLVDLNESTGTTRLHEGSHRDLARVSDYIDKPGAKYPACRMGDIYLMDLRLVHAGTANKSQHKRPIIYLTYTRNWYFDIDNTVTQNVPSVVMYDSELAAVPEPYRYLLSYANIMPRNMKRAWWQQYANHLPQND